jgi:hypothetical protein
MEARVHDPGSIRRLLALVDDACASGLSSQTTAEGLKRAVSAGVLSSREIAEHTMSLLLGGVDEIGVYTSLSSAVTTTAMQVSPPTRDGVAAGDRGNPVPAWQPPPRASELKRASCASELAAAWSAFASLARGLTSRPWPEVERAFIDIGSREAAETRAVAAGPPMEGGGNPGGWLLDIDQNALEQQPDPASTYAAIISTWQQWCECTRRVGGLGAAQKLLTGMAIEQGHGGLGSDHWHVGRRNSLGGLPATDPNHLRSAEPTHFGNSQPDQIHRVDTSHANRESPAVQLSPVPSQRSGLDLHLATPRANRGHPTIHRKTPRSHPRQPSKTRIAPKTGMSPSSIPAVRTPRQPRSRACPDSRAPATRSQSTRVNYRDDGNFGTSRDVGEVTQVDSASEGHQIQPQNETSSASPEEGEPPSVVEEDSNKDGTSECSDLASGRETVFNRVAGQGHNSEQGSMCTHVEVEAEARKPDLEGMVAQSGTSYQQTTSLEVERNDDDNGDDDGDGGDGGGVGVGAENNASDAGDSTHTSISKKPPGMHQPAAQNDVLDSRRAPSSNVETENAATGEYVSDLALTQRPNEQREVSVSVNIGRTVMVASTETRSASPDDAAIRSRLIRTSQNLLCHSAYKLDGAPLLLSPRSSAVRLRLEQKTSATTTQSNTERESTAASRDSAIRAKLLVNAARSTAREGGTGLEDTARCTIRARLAATQTNTE